MDQTKQNTLQQIVDELMMKKLFTKGAVEDLLSSRGVPEKGDAIINIIIGMIRTHPICWTDFISDKVLEAAECTQSYVNLLTEIGSRNLVHLLCRLTELHKRDAALALNLYQELDRKQDRNLSFAMGYVLGGIGVKDLGRFMSIMDSSGSPEPHQKTAYVLALHIAFQSHPDAIMPDKYAKMIIDNTGSSEQQLRRTAIHTMLAVLASHQAFFGVLKALATTDPIASQEIASMSTVLAKTNKRAALELLSICSESMDDNVVSNVALSLGTLAPEFPIECLQIIKRWTRLKEPAFIQWSDFLLEQIGKGDIKSVSEFTREWVEEEDNPLSMFRLPKIIWRVYKSNKEELLDLMHSLDLRYTRNRVLIVEILDKALSELHGQIRQTDEFVGESYELLMKIARTRTRTRELTKQVRRKLTKQKIRDRVLVSLAIIESMKFASVAPSPRTIRSNMRLFPNIRSRLRGRQLNNMLRRKNISHPLMILLSDAKPSTQRLKKLHASYKNENDPLNKAITAMFISNQFYSRAFLSRIDAALGLFGRGEQGMCHAVKGLLNEDQFFQTVSELDVAAQLRKSHPVILQHKVGSRPVDIKVAVDGREYLIEVYGPDTELRLKYVRTAMIISNRVRKRILEKIDKQLKHVAASTTLPILLAIDKSRAADIDEIDVLDTMKGSLSVGIAYNSDQSNPAQTYVFRRDDSIARDSPDAGVVSAIILLKRDMDMTDYKVKLYGEIYLNEKATRPLDECEVGSFRLALFEQSLD